MASNAKKETSSVGYISTSGFGVRITKNLITSNPKTMELIHLFLKEKEQAKNGKVKKKEFK